MGVDGLRGGHDGGGVYVFVGGLGWKLNANALKTRTVGGGGRAASAAISRVAAVVMSGRMARKFPENAVGGVTFILDLHLAGPLT